MNSCLSVVSLDVVIVRPPVVRSRLLDYILQAMSPLRHPRIHVLSPGCATGYALSGVPAENNTQKMLVYMEHDENIIFKSNLRMDIRQQRLPPGHWDLLSKFGLPHDPVDGVGLHEYVLHKVTPREPVGVTLSAVYSVQMKRSFVSWSNITT